jgi:GT2 family glycosyltransferase
MLASQNAKTTLVVTSPELRPDDVAVAVTLPTYKRPGHLLKTLESLRSQTSEKSYAVIVMENDAEGLEGARAAVPLFETGHMRGLVVIAHERGNCSAYNAGWETALRTFPNLEHIAVIDDDEIAAPDWLDHFVSCAKRLSADIAGGPQMPVFEDEPAHPLAAHPVFSPPYAETAIVDALYSSGNLLVSRPVLDAMGYPFLDPRFNFLGGGDSDFLSRAAARGFRLAWCNEAVIHETVPARRLEWDWIRARAVRNGVISTLVEKRKRQAEPLGAARTFLKSIALAAASPLRALPRIVRSRSLKIGLYPVHVAAGRILAQFGYAHEQYRNAEKN